MLWTQFRKCRWWWWWWWWGTVGLHSHHTWSISAQRCGERRLGKTEVLDFSDLPFLDFGTRHLQVKGILIQLRTERTNTQWNPNLSSPWRSASPSTAPCVSPVFPVSHRDTLTDSSSKAAWCRLLFWSIFSRKPAENRCRAWKHEAATVKTVTLCICWANFRHCGTRTPRSKEKADLSRTKRGKNPAAWNENSFVLKPDSVNHTFWNWKWIIFWHVSITQVGLRSAFTAHVSARSVCGHFWCVTHWMVRKTS